jgi:hypothetical protein
MGQYQPANACGGQLQGRSAPYAADAGNKHRGPFQPPLACFAEIAHPHLPLIAAAFFGS